MKNHYTPLLGNRIIYSEKNQQNLTNADKKAYHKYFFPLATYSNTLSVFIF